MILYRNPVCVWYETWSSCSLLSYGENVQITERYWIVPRIYTTQTSDNFSLELRIWRTRTYPSRSSIYRNRRRFPGNPISIFFQTAQPWLLHRRTLFTGLVVNTSKIRIHFSRLRRQPLAKRTFEREELSSDRSSCESLPDPGISALRFRDDKHETSCTQLVLQYSHSRSSTTPIIRHPKHWNGFP